ncbi:tetratricopeptide repeat protein [Streptomyces sp. O3]
MVAEDGISGTLDEVLVKARTLFHQKRYAEAKPLFAQLTDHSAHAAEGLYGLGMVALVGGDLADAEARFNGCLLSRPGHDRALAGLGRIAERRGDASAALKFYADAADRGNASARKALARLRQSTTPPAGQHPSTRPGQGDTPPLARQPSGTGVVGQITCLQQRQEPRLRKTPLTVITFRVEQRSDDGTKLPLVPVELRGEKHKGSLSNGDWVEVTHPGKARQNVMNLTTGEKVSTDEGELGTGWAVALGVLLVFVLVTLLEVATEGSLLEIFNR